MPYFSLPCAGQEKFRTIVASYYRGAHGILLAYDTTNAASFENLGYWLQEGKRFGSSTCPVVLGGTKTDLKSKRVVPEEAVRAFAEQYCGGANTLVETSAKTNEGVEQAFQLLAQQVFKQRVNVDVVEPPRQVPRSLLQPTPEESSQCGC
jgi:Ras-related protein Rab-1A